MVDLSGQGKLSRSLKLVHGKTESLILVFAKSRSGRRTRGVLQAAKWRRVLSTGVGTVLRRTRMVSSDTRASYPVSEDR